MQEIKIKCGWTFLEVHDVLRVGVNVGGVGVGDEVGGG
jgi:hypothetical protein